MVGGGQLARMTHQAAIALDVELVVLAADPLDATVSAMGSVRIGDPADLNALRRLAGECDVLTFDHEGIPGEHLETLESEGFNLRPGAGAKRTAQDKLHARTLLREAGFPVPDFAPVSTADDVARLAERLSWPLVLKARRGGYDGRGVAIVEDAAAAATVIAGGGEWVGERCVPIATELSQIVARTPGGACVAYPLAETVQRDGICVETRAPADVKPEVAERCAELANSIAAAIGATGVMAVELFLTAGDELLVNELALRPHNSGHFTIEGCGTSQFENHLRAVLDWPLGSTELRSPAVVMTNVLGSQGSDPAARLAEALGVQGAHPHLYGKQPSEGRKLGHVTALGSTVEEAQAASSSCAGILELGAAA